MTHRSSHECVCVLHVLVMVTCGDQCVGGRVAVMRCRDMCVYLCTGRLI